MFDDTSSAQFAELLRETAEALKVPLDYLQSERPLAQQLERYLKTGQLSDCDPDLIPFPIWDGEQRLKLVDNRGPDPRGRLLTVREIAVERHPIFQKVHQVHATFYSWSLSAEPSQSAANELPVNELSSGGDPTAGQPPGQVDYTFTSALPLDRNLHNLAEFVLAPAPPRPSAAEWLEEWYKERTGG